MLNPFSTVTIVTQREATDFLIDLMDQSLLEPLEKEAYKLFTFTQKKGKTKLTRLISDWAHKDATWNLKNVVAFKLQGVEHEIRIANMESELYIQKRQEPLVPCANCSKFYKANYLARYAITED
jgi:hypothetical protein